MDSNDEETVDTVPLVFRLGSRLVTAKRADLLDPRRTIYRLELNQSPFLPLVQSSIMFLCPLVKSLLPEWFLPATVILKTQKDGWEDEFQTEKRAYDILKPIQGTTIPHFFGETVYNGSPTLVLSVIDGTTLFDLARGFSEDEYDALRQSLEIALRAITSYGVDYTDEKLDNFLALDDWGIMIVDLEQVVFDTTKAWEESNNCARVDRLMQEFMGGRKPRQPSFRDCCCPVSTQDRLPGTPST
ncbi:hypothetical protein B0H66DRAFT_506442 [Apodospora peruviana]|uniref:Protein kinase domain-containing protein n=1 Tax=Apodospora peruviana TaxID=516989 RepID=A0AAE0LY16_9PEZI|nr:hypothetical protein B0H66DRAFT_506442 [Apodospora peruviana]